MLVSLHRGWLEIEATALGKKPKSGGISFEELEKKPINTSWDVISIGEGYSETVIATLCARTGPFAILEIVGIHQRNDGLVIHRHEWLCIVRVNTFDPQIWLIPA